LFFSDKGAADAVPSSFGRDGVVTGIDTTIPLTRHTVIVYLVDIQGWHLSQLYRCTNIRFDPGPAQSQMEKIEGSIT
jgi:hypothetical protein